MMLNENHVLREHKQKAERLERDATIHHQLRLGREATAPLWRRRLALLLLTLAERLSPEVGPVAAKAPPCPYDPTLFLGSGARGR